MMDGIIMNAVGLERFSSIKTNLWAQTGCPKQGRHSCLRQKLGFATLTPTV